MPAANEARPYQMALIIELLRQIQKLACVHFLDHKMILAASNEGNAPKLGYVERISGGDRGS